jgi:hypothetical protein
MPDEIHPSYRTTTIHARITCGCGTIVWYGASEKLGHKPPRGCSKCLEKEQLRLHPPKAQAPITNYITY